MDKRKNNGGKREGAGRKSKSEEMQLIEMSLVSFGFPYI